MSSSEPTQPLVLYSVEGKVATITLNRPEKRNALTRQLWVEFDKILSQAEDDPDTRVIILTGAGPSFCSGADLAGDEDPTSSYTWFTHNQRHHRRQFRIWDSQKIWIAAVDGYALGRGCEIALWCDIVVAAEDSHLGLPEIRQAGVLHSVIPWISPIQKAKLFMIEGNTLSARDAEDLGIVTKVVEAGGARREAAKLAKRLAHIPALAAQSIKKMVNGVYEAKGFRDQQQLGIGSSSFNAALPPEERGIAELTRVGKEQGFKAWLAFRDAPFKG